MSMKKKPRLKAFVGICLSGCLSLQTVLPVFAAPTQAQTDILLSDGSFSARLSSSLPVVYEYETQGKVMKANTDGTAAFVVNGKEETPTVQSVQQIGHHKAAYEMSFPSGESVTVEMSVEQNEYGGILTMRYLDISEGIQTLQINGQGLLSAQETDKVSYNLMYYRTDTIEQPGNQVGNKNNIGHIFISTPDGLAASMETSMFGQSVCSETEDNTTLFSSNAHIIRGPENTVTEEPWVKTVITADRNQDQTVDWQDGAVAYREIMDDMPGDQMLARQSTYVQVGLNYRNKFPRPYEQVIDDAKRLSNATDGFPQIIEMKNAHEGLDGWPSYGNGLFMLGGTNSFNWMIENAQENGIFVGTHTNSYETYSESYFHTLLNEYDMERYAQTGNWNDSIIARDGNGQIVWNGGWKCMDLETSTLNERNYFKSGLLQQFYQLQSDTFPQLKFQYLDIRTGNDAWSSLMTIKEFKEHGWNIFGEYASGDVGHSDVSPTHGAKYLQWIHNFGADVDSALRRFVLNDQVISGNTKGGASIADLDKVLGFGDTTKNGMWGSHGWANNNSQESLEEQIDIFWRQILPDTFLKNYQILGFTRQGNDMTATFEGGDDTVRVEWHDSEGLRYIYKNDILVAKVSRGDFQVNGAGYYNPRYTATDKAQIFIPYAENPEEYEFPGQREDKIYTHSDKEETVRWELPESWKNLKNVVLYKLDETEGKTDPQTIPVQDGMVEIQYTDTFNGYVVYKGEVEQEATVWGDSDGTRMHVRDFEFNSELGSDSPWSVTGDAVVEQQEPKRYVYSPQDSWLNTEPSTGYSGTPTEIDTSNKYLRFTGDEEASVSQTITGLIPGASYAFTMFVDVQNQDGETKKAVLQISDTDGNNLCQVASQDYKIGTTNYERLNGWEMLRVYYTAPADGKAQLTIRATAGAGDVRVDCVRSFLELSPYGREGNYYLDTYEDNHWLGAFVHARYNESQGQTLTKESKYARDVIYTLSDGSKTLEPTEEILNDGVYERSLKLRPPVNSTVPILNTLPGLLALEKEKNYVLSFDYTSEPNSGDANWTLDVYSPSAQKVVQSFPLQAQQGQIEEFTGVFQTQQYSDCIVRLTGGSGDLLIDNFALKTAEDLTSYTVTASCTGHGTVSPAEQSVFEGTDAQVLFVPDPGYALRSIQVNGEEIPVEGNTVTLRKVSSDMTVVGEFAKVKEVHFKFTDGTKPDDCDFWVAETYPADAPLGSVKVNGKVGGVYQIEGLQAHAIKVQYNNANGGAVGSASLSMDLYVGESDESQQILLPNDCPGWNGIENYKTVTIPLRTPITPDITSITIKNSGPDNLGGLASDFWLICWDDEEEPDESVHETHYLFKDGQKPEDCDLWIPEENPADAQLGSVKVNGAVGGVYSLDGHAYDSIRVRYNNANGGEVGSAPLSLELSVDNSEKTQTILLPNDCPGWNGAENYKEVTVSLDPAITAEAKEITIKNVSPIELGGLISDFWLISNEKKEEQPADTAQNTLSLAVPENSPEKLPKIQTAETDLQKFSAALQLTVNYAQELNSGLYCSEDWKVMGTWLKKAKQYLDGQDVGMQPDVIDYRLAQAILEMEPKSDLAQAQQLLEQSKTAMEDESYTQASRDRLRGAVETAESMIWEGADANDIVRCLNAANDQLVSLAQLQMDWNGRILEQGTYPDESWKEYQAMLSRLEEALAYAHLTGNDTALLHEEYQNCTGALKGDSEPPVVSDTLVRVEYVTSTSAKIAWNKADDNLGQNDLTYFVYMSSRKEDVSGEDMATKAQLLTPGGLVNQSSFTAEELEPETAYWMSVLVRDKAGNCACYAPVSVKTAQAKPDDTQAPNLEDRVLRGEDISTRSFTLRWTAAQDDQTPANMLRYSVYYAEKQDDVKDIAAMESSSQKVNNMPLYGTDYLQIQGLHRSSTYYFNVVVEDEAGNKNCYEPICIRTAETPSEPDKTAPTVHDSSIFIANQNEQGVMLNWIPATDNAYEDEELTYYVYRCVEDGNEDDVRNITNLLDPAHAVLLNPEGGKNISSFVVDSGLTPGKLYWYNILVEDPEGNRSIYSQVRAYATLPVQYEIRVNAGEGGTIVPGTCRINEGDDARFRILPDDGYSLEKVLLDGAALPVENNTVVLNNVQQDHTLEAVFEKQETAAEKVTVHFDVEGTVTDVSVQKGDAVLPPQQPEKEGFEFLGWYTAGGDKYDFTMPVWNEFTLYARFEKAEENTGAGGNETDTSGENTPAAGIPATGDNSGAAMCLCLLTVSMLAGVGMVRYRRRKVKGKE